MIRQLTLQCCHHCLTQLHSPPPQFIQNQTPIHRLSHQHYAHCHHQWKVYIQRFRKLIFFSLAIIFSQSEHQNAEGSDRVLSLHQKEVRFETTFSVVVHILCQIVWVLAVLT